ncbi:MAG TPA: CPBP family glutamic-type intramembrane protease [Conexibacter sp.]
MSGASHPRPEPEPALSSRPELPDGIEPSAPSRPPGRPGVPRFVDPGPREVPPEQPNAWTPWSAPVAIIGAFIVAFLGQAVILVIGSFFGMSASDPSPASNIIATAFQDCAFIGVAIFIARSAGPVTFGQFGVRRTPIRLAVFWIVAATISFYILTAIYSAVFNITNSDNLPDSLGLERSTVAFVAVCILVTVIAPLAEEFLFRGFFFGAVRNWRGPWVAAVITAIVFGGIHVGSAGAEFLPPLAILGFLLCIVRWRTGSLVPCIMVHSINNAIAFGVTAGGWGAWQVILLLIGSTSVCLLILRPVMARSGDAPARALT